MSEYGTQVYRYVRVPRKKLHAYSLGVPPVDSGFSYGGEKEVPHKTYGGDLFRPIFLMCSVLNCMSEDSCPASGGDHGAPCPR